MKNKIRSGLIALAITVGGVAAASALSAATNLAEGVEHLDSELHAIHAPAHVINLVHHTEETVFEFVDLLTNHAPRPTILAEYAHIRTDVRQVRSEMITHRYFRNARIEAETWHVYSAARLLDHELYHGHGGGHGGGHGRGPGHL